MFIARRQQEEYPVLKSTFKFWILTPNGEEVVVNCLKGRSIKVILSFIVSLVWQIEILFSQKLALKIH